MNTPFYKFMLVTHRQQMPMGDYLNFIKICTTSGITAVQLREKESSSVDRFNLGKRLKSLLDPLNIALIINDDIDLALKLDASGVHLGQSDGCPERARALLGPNKAIGVSIDSTENLIHANALPIDYVGIGAIYPTTNKQHVATIWGIQGLKTLSSQSKHPVIAIGGINENNAAEVLSSGAEGIAVIGALHETKNPGNMALHLRSIIDKCPQC